MLAGTRSFHRAASPIPLLFFLVALPDEAFGREGRLLWEDRVDRGGTDSGGVVAARDGLVVAVGPSETRRGSADWAIAVRTYDGASGSMAWQDSIYSGRFQDGPGVVAIGAHIAVVGADPGIIRAYDLAAGTLLWEDHFAATKIGSVQALVIHDHELVATGYGGVGCFDADDFAGCDMTTRAYDVRTGKLLWKDLFNGFGGMDLGSSVAATEDVVVVTGNARPGGFDRSDGSAYVVRAYNADSGALAWQDIGPMLPTFPFGSQVAAGDGKVFVVGKDNRGDGLVRAYQPRTGAMLWTQAFSLAPAGLEGIPDIAFQVATQGARVVVAGYGSRVPVPPAGDVQNERDWVVNTYDARSGTLLWSDVHDVGRFPDEAVGGIAIQGGQAFAYGLVTRAPFVSAARDLLLRAYDLDSGRVLWQDEVDKGGFEIPWGTWFSGLAVDKGRMTILGSTRFSLPDRSLTSDWIVRTYSTSSPRNEH